jgi:serine/threonine protein kinase
VKNKDKRTCSICGTLFDSGSESCPVCALRDALQSETPAFEIPPTDSDLRFEHYRVLKNEDGTPIELGRGAMGVTYKAFDVLLHRPVALKIINALFIGDASARNRFVREARAAASVRHPNVASVFHLGEADGDYFYAMAFVEGETLQDLIQHTGRLNTTLALEIAAQAAAGLAAIHKQHLVHRDIKPSNIMVSVKEGLLENVEIIDLGLAKGVAEEGSLSAPGAFVGTPGYASPEQFAAVGVDIRSDLYSLGITLWKMLSGSPPFQGKTSELVYQHQHVPPPFDRLIGVPKQVVPLLEILLEKDPARRFQTPNDLLKAITVVTDALNSGRRLTRDELRSRAAKIVLQKRSGASSRDLPARTGKGVHILGWLGLSLAVAALLVGLFLFSRSPEPSLHSPRDATGLMEKGVAVLPFESLSPNKDDSYFADGVQDEILNNLAKIAQLKVISRTSVMQYRTETKRDLRQIAYTLGVAHVLEGTVQRNGDRGRVSTELVDGRDDQTIWADSYDRDLTDIFAIQSEVAQTIAAKLAATLSPAEKKIIEAKPTDNLEAYDLYLRAKELIFGAELSSAAAIVKQPLLDAVGFLDKAVSLDPNFALAYCASANAHDLLYFWYDQTAERLALSDAAIRAASRLQPGLPEVHLADARHLYRGYRNYDAARAQLAIAKRGLPNNVEVIFLEALMDRRQGEMERAIQRLK